MKRLRENCHFERFDPSSFQNVKVFVNNKDLPPICFIAQGINHKSRCGLGWGKMLNKLTL